MYNFDKICDSLKYIDNHLDEELNVEVLSKKYCFSTFYFYHMFSVIVGKPLATYVRERRILYAAEMLSSTELTIMDISLICGYESAQSFSRAFRTLQGVSPRTYRKERMKTMIETPDELIKKFTNRIKGGIFVQPNIIKREKLIIAGVQGDVSQTAEVWKAFENLMNEKPLKNVISNDGYEVRISDGEKSIVFVGTEISNNSMNEDYSIMILPASKYASFDVYVNEGYDSENDAMTEWLEKNQVSYREKLMKDGSHYCVEHYDERFQGNESESLVEIWIPIEKR